jgi:hypothetical protein
MTPKQQRDFLRRFGPPETWMISAEEIEAVMLAGPCRHFEPRLMDCQRGCLPAALTERQMARLAERLGCSVEDAAAVGESLTRKDGIGWRP